MDHTIKKESHGYQMLQVVGTKSYRVVKVSDDRRRVMSAMPSDGSFFAPYTDSGIAYVSHCYSYSYARRMFIELSSAQAEAEEYWK